MQSPEKSILISLATLNEELNIKSLVEEIHSLHPNATILVVDGASTDKTVTNLRNLQKEIKSLKVIQQSRRLGLSSAHLVAFNFAIENNFQFLVTMDADWSHHPKFINNMLTAAEDADLVIGSRYCKAGVSDYSGIRNFVSKTANYVLSKITNSSLNEFTTSFRVFRVSTLSEIDVGLLYVNGYSFFFKIMTIYLKNKKIILEVPIHFYDRKHGKSKISKMEIFKSIFTLWRICFKNENLNKYFGANYGRCRICKSNYRIQISVKSRNYVSRDNNLRCTQENADERPSLVKCNVCGHISSLEEEWPSSTENSYHVVEDNEYLEVEFVKRKTFSWVLSYLRKFNKLDSDIFKSVLEIGSYAGIFLDVLKGEGIPAVGVEPSKWGSNIAFEKGHSVNNSRIEDLNFKQLPICSLVVSWDVLEHLENPILVMENVNSILEKGGLFVFSTLDIDTWFPKLMGKKWPWYMPMHLHYFDKSTIIQMASISGFEVLDDRPYRSYASLQYACRRFLTAMNIPLRIASIISKFIPKFLVIPFSFGDVRIFALRKT